MLRLATLPFAIEGDAALQPSERRVVAPLEDAPRAGEGAPFVLRIVDAPPCAPAAGTPWPAGRSAAVEVRGDEVLLASPAMAARLDPFAGEGTLYRQGDDDVAIHLALTAAACCRLPLAGGIALHSAAVARPGGAALFFGPSGAGKSTIARSSPHAVLSDELNVVFERPGGFEVRCLGFWGTQNAFDAPRGGFPLRALVQLEKGTFSLTRLAPAEAARALVAMVRLPTVDALWRIALPLVTRLGTAVPAYRMRWSPEDPPWERLAPLFAGESPR